VGLGGKSNTTAVIYLQGLGLCPARNSPGLALQAENRQYPIHEFSKPN